MKYLPPLVSATVAAANAAGALGRINEYVVLPGHDKRSHVKSPLPHS